MKLGELLKKLRPRSVQAGGDQRSVDNVDAQAARGSQKDLQGGVAGSAPPGWVPGADEGRPRH